MPNNNWSEKRRNVRVNIEMRAEVRILETLPNGKKKSEGVAITRLMEFIHLVEEKQDPIITFLMDSISHISEKVDHLAAMLPEKKEPSALKIIRTIDFSGAGMHFILQGNVRKGQHLEIFLRIPRFTLGRLALIGEVIYAGLHPDDAASCMDVGVKFVELTEEERDALVSFVFYQQRKAIRQHRQTEGDKSNGGTSGG